MVVLMASEDTAKRLGAAVRQLLGSVSQVELARRLGVDPSVVSRWVNGKAPFTHQDVADIEDALRLRPGTVATAAGYYDPDSPLDIPAQLLMDDNLSPEDRVLLAQLYERARLRRPANGVRSVPHEVNDGH